MIESLVNRIFNLQTEAEFQDLALQVARFQLENVAIYRSYAEAIGRANPTRFEDIPFLPINFFKTHDVINGKAKAELTFLSSGTTGQDRSRHLIADPEIYRQSFRRTYRQQIGPPEEQVILALLPNYIQQGQSSLVYMVNDLIERTGDSRSGFLLDHPEEVIERYNSAITSQRSVILFGVSYALLDLAEKHIDLSQARIIETGGMKGRRKELSKAELHQLLCEGLGVDFISSEYGMTELLSQAYSQKNGLFKEPKWMRAIIRQTNDPFTLAQEGHTGAINIVDLANIWSCSFIETADLGKRKQNGFRLMGRVDLSDIRGCNQLVS